MNCKFKFQVVSFLEEIITIKTAPVLKCTLNRGACKF